MHQSLETRLHLRARGGRGWNRFKSHSLHVLQCLARNGFVARNRKKKKKKSIYLSHPGDNRAFTQTDCLLLKAERGGRCIVKKQISRRVHFYCLHWLPVIKNVQISACKTPHVPCISSLDTSNVQKKRRSVSRQKTSTSTARGGRGDFVKMWECIRMQEMVWWREGLLGETDLHMEIRVSVDKILLTPRHYFVLIWAGALQWDWGGQEVTLT